MELKTITFLLISAALGWLIVAKGDKQLVHILEGKLHRTGRPTGPARAVYGKHIRVASVAEFAAGLCLLFLALIWPSTETAMVLGLGGVVLCTLGVWGRVRSFLRADQELN